MLIVINRIKDFTECNTTIGELTLLDGKKELLKGYSLELKNKKIKSGLYKTKWHYSPKNKMYVPLLFNKDLQDSRYIEIHTGNKAEDTQGCILVGREYKEDTPFIYNSKYFFNLLMYNIKYGALSVLIHDKIKEDS